MYVYIHVNIYILDIYIYTPDQPPWRPQILEKVRDRYKSVHRKQEVCSSRNRSRHFSNGYLANFMGLQALSGPLTGQIVIWDIYLSPRY